MAASTLKDAAGNVLATEVNTAAVSAADVTAPVYASAEISGGNKVVTLTYNENVVSNVADLKAAVTFSADGNTFSALGANDTVAIVDGKLVVTFENALTGTTNAIKVAASTLKDAAGNVLATEVSATNVATDTTPPALGDAAIYDATAGTVTLDFDENLFNALIDLTALKASVTYSTDGTTYSNTNLSSVAINNDKLVLFFAPGTLPLSTTLTVKIDAGALRDEIGNTTTAAITTANIDSTKDNTPPTANGYSISGASIVGFANEKGTLGLYSGDILIGSTVALVGGGFNFTNNHEPLAVYAQTTLTSATLKIADEAGNFASNTRSVFLGTDGTDTITGSAVSDLIFGFGGADSMSGGDGHDVFAYSSFADLFASNALVDQIDGGAGNNTLVFSEAGTITASDLWTRASNIKQLFFGSNLLTQDESEKDISITLDTSAYTAGIRLVNLGGDSTSEGTNTINASSQTDANIALTLTGGFSVDSITGGSGNDTITGGAGADLLTGGDGADTFVFANTAANNGQDTITDLTVGAGGDVLNFSAFTPYGGIQPYFLPSVLTANVSPGSGNVTNLISRLVDIAGGQDITTAEGLTTALAVGGEYANLDLVANAKAIFITSASSDPGNNFVFYATSDATGAVTATLVGTLSNVDIDNFVLSNFLV